MKSHKYVPDQLTVLQDCLAHAVMPFVVYLKFSFHQASCVFRGQIQQPSPGQTPVMRIVLGEKFL